MVAPLFDFKGLLKVSAFLIHLLATFHLVGMPAGAVQGNRIAQATATSPYQVATEAASSKLYSLQNTERSLYRNKQKLRSTYNKQLSEVDRLKRSRASWRRDRQLRDQKAQSQKTASALQALDRRIRATKVATSQMRKILRQAISRELTQPSSSQRRSQLSKKLAALGGKPKRAPRKITMPDLELDELADAQELLTQIAMIERAEAKLAIEERSLGRRAEHYAHMDVLRQKRQRSGELGAFDNTGVRRSIGRVGDGTRKSESDSFDDTGSAGAGQDASNEQSPGPPLAEEPSGGSDFATASVVLSDVVDAETQTALRQAQRSTSPRTKAKAAKRARTQVKSQLGALKSGKARILLRLRRLQGN